MLIGSNGEKKGLVALSVALESARDLSLDLVQVSPSDASPIVCKLLDYGKLKETNFNEKIKELYLNKKKSRLEILGEEQANSLERKIFLQIIDFSWRSHLQYLEQLRQVIGLRSYGQKDPLSEFKKEAFLLFEGLLEKIKTDIIKFLLNLNIVISDKNDEKENQTFKSAKKIGRNDKCSCGSGKKYKHCCGLI